MQLSLAIWLVVACLAPLTIIAQWLSIGKCPYIKELDTFDIDRFMGVWYQYSSYPEFQETGTKCNSVEYKKIDNNTISAEYSYRNASTGDLSIRRYIRKIVTPGQLQVDYSKNENPFNIILLGTDYDSYAVIYSCSKRVPLTHFKHVWILTRSCNPSQESKDEAKKILEDNNISTSYLFRADQEHCPASFAIQETA